MGMRKPNVRRPLVNGRGFQSKRSIVNGGRSQMKRTEPNDHWDFLEEIDAPMWVDLTLESKSMDQDRDNKWFQVAHPFHQCSIRHLNSAFPGLSEGETNSNASLLGPSSPKLPPSVSRSRGKHYRSRKWRGGNHVVSEGKQHPIGFVGRTLQMVSGSGHEVKPKISYGNAKQSSDLKARLPVERSLINNIRPNSLKTKPIFRYPKSIASSKASLVGESNSTEAMRPISPQNKPSFVDSERSLSLNSSSVGERNSTISSGHDSLKPKSSFGNSSSYTGRPNSPKTKPRFGDSESTSSLNENFIGESNSTNFNGSEFPKDKSSFGDSKISSNSEASTVTECNQQEQQTISEVSHQIFGHTSGLLSAVRISLRKSCVTRQASRVEVKERRQSKGRKSSSSKSSVGSSKDSGCNLNNTMHTARMNKNITSKCREVVKMDQSTAKGKSTNVSKTSNGRFLDLNCYSKHEEKSIAMRSVHQETTKSKVLHQSEPRKSSFVRNLQDPFNVGLEVKGVVNSRKVNAVKKSGGKENIVGSMVWSQKGSRNGFELKDDKRLSDPKIKACGRSKGKNLKNVVQRVYFR